MANDPTATGQTDQNTSSSDSKKRRIGRKKKQGVTLQDFETSVLKHIGAPLTDANYAFLNAWARREGAGGAFNPLNTTLSAAGATSMNSVGVKNYTDWKQGARATADTLLGGNYSDIVSAMRTGKISTDQTFHGLSTWSGGGYSTLAGTDTKPYVLYSQAGGKGALGGGSGGAGVDEALLNGGVMPSSHLSKGAIAEGLNSLGFASQLIHSNKSLTQAFDEILSKQLDLTSSAGQARAKQILQNTAWFQNHTKNQREFEELKFSDPQTWQKSIDDTRASLVNEAKSMGLSIDPNELDHLAHMVTRNGLTSDEINHVLSKQFDYSKGQAYDGTAGQTIDSIRQQAASYYVPVSDGQIQHYTRQVLSGALDPQSLADTFKQQALSLYPYLKQQLDSGQTVADIADPYKQMMAQTLELDPNAIKHTDPTVLKALQSTDQHGNVGIMPLWQFQQHLYSDPRWMQTQNAHESLVGTTGSILQKMGLIT